MLRRFGFALLALTAAGQTVPATAQTVAALPQAEAPPPRTIRDITSILDRITPSTEGRFHTEAPKADEKITDDMPPMTRIAALTRRGVAAGRLGRVKQGLDDLREAARLSEAEKFGDYSNILWELADLEGRGGSLGRALELRQKAIASIPGEQRNRLAPWLGVLAMMQAGMGDIESASATIAKAETALNDQRRSRNWGQWGRLWTGQVLRGKARVLHVQGKFKEASAIYREAIAEIEAQISAHGKGEAIDRLLDYARSEHSMTLQAMNRLPEAELEARRALMGRLNDVGKYSSETPSILARLANILLEQGRTDDAIALSRAAIEIHKTIGTAEGSNFYTSARGNLAVAELVLGRWKDAERTIAALRSSIAGDATAFSRTAGINLNFAISDLHRGDVASARAIAEAARSQALKARGPRSFPAGEANCVLGMAEAAEGQFDSALQRFRESVPVILSRSRQVADEGSARSAQEWRKGRILEAYLDLLMSEAQKRTDPQSRTAALDEAFRIADIARSQSVQRALADSAARAQVPEPMLAELIRKEQDTLKDITALNGTMLSLLERSDDAAATKKAETLRVEIDKLRDTRGALADEITKRFPAYSELVNPKPVGLDEVSAALAPGEVMVSFYVGERWTYVWAIPKDGAPSFGRTALGADALADKVAALRAALDPNAGMIEQIPAFDVAAAHDLYKALLQPVETAWKPAKTIVAVPHGALGYLPLSLLPTAPKQPGKDGQVVFSSYRDVPWLARTHAVAQLPSAASLKALRAAKAGDGTRKAFAGFGDPYFNAQQAAEGTTGETAQMAMRGGKVALVRRNASRMAEADSTRLSSLPRLADTRSELLSLARAMKAEAGDVFLGKDANEQRVKTMPLASYRVLAFATHGLVPGELDGLTEPALALTAPEIAGVEGDGLLTLAEVLALKLNADWIVLSACNTASGDGAGAEAVSGLGRAFFYAGTRALLATNWPVHSTSAAKLTTELFRRQMEGKGLARAEALRQAMLAVIDGKGFEDQGTGREVFAYAHPLFWAPFSLVGDGS